MKQVTLENLHCTKTEDWTGADSCRLEIFADGELEHAYRAELNDGWNWPLNTSLLFEREVTVRLYDEDGGLPGDDDDALGIVSIPAMDTGRVVGAFTEDDAAYELTYHVSDRSDLAAVNRVELELQGFEASTAPGVWLNIAKADLVADMRATIADPVRQVDQVNSQFCGPTSIVFELVRRMPRRYVRLCRSLYETGTFRSRTHAVTASEGLRATSVGQGMSVADWVLIATMRESENAVFGVDPNASGAVAGVQGLTTHWEMEGWTAEMLLKQNTAISTTFVWGEMDAIRYAERVFAAGGVAFVMIHADLLSTDDSSFIPPWPTHWVVYNGGLAEWDGRIAFNVYTWGENKLVSKPADRFESCMFGIVTGF
jgi:hypothetical protein